MVYTENLCGTKSRSYGDVRLRRQLDQAGDGNDAAATVLSGEEASETPLPLPTCPVPKGSSLSSLFFLPHPDQSLRLTESPSPSEQSESVASSGTQKMPFEAVDLLTGLSNTQALANHVLIVESQVAPRARTRKSLPVTKLLQGNKTTTKKTSIATSAGSPAGKEPLHKLNTDGSDQVLPLHVSRREATSAQALPSSKSVTAISTSLCIQKTAVLRVGCDIISPKGDGMTQYPCSRNRGTRGVAILKKPTTTPRRRYKTPVSRITPKNAVTPVRIAKFKKLEAKALERKTSGVQRKGRIFHQKIQTDGLTENRLELFWNTLGKLKTAGKLFTDIGRMNSEEGAMCCFDSIETCVKAVNGRISREHKKFGKREGMNVVYELQNQRMFAIAGVNNMRVFLTRDAQAALGA